MPVFSAVRHNANIPFGTARARLCATGLVMAALASGFGGQALAQSSEGLSGMRLTNTAPIAIEGDKLEVNEESGVAIFTGAVQVTQDGTSMKAGKLTVFYDKKGEGSVATGSAAIKRLEMDGKVVLSSPTQTATGDAGAFDMASETFVLTGQRVVLTEGGNVAVGCKLTVAMKTGKADLEGCKGGGTGRVQIMINPKSAQGN
jgi:lipopolysaccharide export system protein LptA